MVSWEELIILLEPENVQMYKYNFKKNNVKVFEIDGEKIKDDESLLVELSNNLPQDPPINVKGKLNLDGLLDALRGGLYILDENKIHQVVFLWNNIEPILEQNINRLLDILEVFSDLKESSSTTEYGLTQPINFKVYLIGKKEELNKLNEILKY